MASTRGGLQWAYTFMNTNALGLLGVPMASRPHLPLHHARRNAANAFGTLPYRRLKPSRHSTGGRCVLARSGRNLSPPLSTCLVCPAACGGSEPRGRRLPFNHQGLRSPPCTAQTAPRAQVLPWMVGLLLLHLGLFFACAALSACKARRIGLPALGTDDTALLAAAGESRLG